MAEVLLMGEVMALMTADKVGALEDAENFTKSLAGAELNVCLGLTRLGHTSSYITKLVSYTHLIRRGRIWPVRVFRFWETRSMETGA